MKNVKIFLDDVRDPPGDGWELARTSQECVELIRKHNGHIDLVSLDHDLGLDTDTPNMDNMNKNGTGYDVLLYIEEAAFYDILSSFEIIIHSMNPPAAQKMRKAVTKIQSIWRGKKVFTS